MSNPNANYRTRRFLLMPLIGVWIIAVGGASASGQLFGPRSLGQPLSAQPRPGLGNVDEAVESAGTLTGSERFLRDNRDATDFVGVDRQETNSFVGAGQVIEAGRVRSAIESLQSPPDRAAQLNQVWAPAAARTPYPPRLEIRFDTPAPDRFWKDSRPPIGHFEIDAVGQLKQVIPGQPSAESSDQDQDLLNLADQGAETGSPAAEVVFDRPNRDLTRRARKSGADTLEVFLNGRTAIIRGAAATPKQRQLAELLLGFEPGISTVRNEIVVVNQ